VDVPIDLLVLQQMTDQRSGELTDPDSSLNSSCQACTVLRYRQEW
jgi:hypothetical protein